MAISPEISGLRDDIEILRMEIVEHKEKYENSIAGLHMRLDELDQRVGRLVVKK